MRIVFVNLHNNGKMVKILNKYIFKISVGRKHRYILDELLKRDITVCSYITKGNGHRSKIANFVSYLSYPIRLFTSKILLNKDGIPAKRIKTLYRLKDIHADDLVILYDIRDEFEGMDKVNAFKVGCLLHTTCSSISANRFKAAHVDCFYNEADLRKNGKMFRHYFQDVPGDIIVIPFVFENRFQSKTPFSERQNKAIGVGTITYRTDKEFLDMYGDGCLQPLRRQARDAAPEMSAFYDSVMSDYGEGVQPKVIKDDDNLFSKLYKVTWNNRHIGQQKNYFSFNMVDKLNQYKMAICAEEIIGVPGIGFVESMACGCAYIGCNKYDYAAYGMEEGTHYIGYDGTLEDLQRKIEYYQLHGDELEQIARTGHEFAIKNFTPEAVTTKLLDELLARKAAYEMKKQTA